MTMHWVYRGGSEGISPLLLVAQLAIGFVLFAVFFFAAFNDRIGLMLGTGGLVLGWNALVSGLSGRRTVRDGLLAALAFGSSAAMFALFGLVDLFARRDPMPFLFWLGTAAGAVGAGLLGVLVARSSPRR